MTDLVAAPASSALALQAGQTYWNDDQLTTLRHLGCENATRADMQVFHHVVSRTGLDPFAKQIHMVERQGKYTIQTGIDGFRLIARRAVDASGETLGYLDTQWCGADGQWTDVWLHADPPAAAKVTVLRNGQSFPAIALFDEYVGRRRDGQPNSMWASKPALMLAKCAEALALRKAFPQDLSGIYSTDEMQATSATVQIDMAQVLAHVTAAQSEDDVRAVWREFASRLDSDQRDVLLESSKIRIDQLHDGPGEHADPETGEIVDAEIIDVEDPPADLYTEPEPDTAPTSGGGARGPLGRDIATRPATAKQIGFLESLARKAGHLDLDAYLAGPAAKSVLDGAPSQPLTDGHARLLIDALKAEAA